MPCDINLLFFSLIKTSGLASHHLVFSIPFGARSVFSAQSWVGKGEQFRNLRNERNIALSQDKVQSSRIAALGAVCR